jgi:hypothetical protein
VSGVTDEWAKSMCVSNALFKAMNTKLLEEYVLAMGCLRWAHSSSSLEEGIQYEVYITNSTINYVVALHMNPSNYLHLCL